MYVCPYPPHLAWTSRLGCRDSWCGASVGLALLVLGWGTRRYLLERLITRGVHVCVDMHVCVCIDVCLCRCGCMCGSLVYALHVGRWVLYGYLSGAGVGAWGAWLEEGGREG